jgi:hypothetical protein
MIEIGQLGMVWLAFGWTDFEWSNLDWVNHIKMVCSWSGWIRLGWFGFVLFGWLDSLAMVD